MFCSVCGNNYDDSVAFCPICGAANNSVAPQSAEATSVEEPTVGNFDSIPPVAPQPVEAPVAVATVVSQPVETAPVAPQPEYQAPVEAQPMVNDVQASFVASVPQAEIVAPVSEQMGAPAPAKKSKKPIIIGVVAALLVAAIVAVVLLFVVPKLGEKSESEAKKEEKTQTATYEVDSPLGDVSAALQKTLFENSGMEFIIKTDYEELYGAIGVGDSGKESGFYCIDSDGYGFGMADYVYYASWEPGDPMPDGFMEDMSEEFKDAGFDIDLDKAIDDVLNDKLDREALEKIYNDNLSDIEAMLEEKMGESITLPESDEIQQFFADFVNEGLTEEAISITESKDGDNTEYEYEINLAELAKCAYEYAKDDSKAEGILTLLGMVFGGSGSDPIAVIGEMIDYYEYDLDFEIEGEIVVNKDGYITKFEIELFGDEVIVELKNFNNVEVTLDVLEEKIEIMEYEDEYYGDDYYEDDYYDDYGEAFIDAEYYDLYLYEGETTSLLIECWGSDLPDYYTFYVEYPDCVSVYWGGWETDTSNRLYVTGEYVGDGYMTVYLRDESNNNIDYTDIYVCVE